MSPIRVGRYNAPSEDEYTTPRGGRGSINRGLNTPVINMQRPGTIRIQLIQHNQVLLRIHLILVPIFLCMPIFTHGSGMKTNLIPN